MLGHPGRSGMPPVGSVAVVPGASAIPVPAGGVVTQIYVGTGGNITCIWYDGSKTFRKSVPAGTTIYGHIVQVLATDGLGNTTASDMVADYV